METTCWSCGEGSVVADPDSGALVCTSCGRVHDAGAAEFVHQAVFTADGQPDLRTSSLLRHHSNSPYRDHKIAAASAIVISIATRIGLSPARAEEALRMASSATGGDLATPESAFLPALAAACAFLVARSHRLPLSLSEAASAASCTASSLSDLASRVASHLSLPPLPSFDYAAALDRAVRSSPSLSAAAAAADKTEVILAHARFLLLCASKWSLTTGRHPLPLVAGVAAFSAQVNGITSVSVDDIARDICAGLHTSRRRLKEITDVLVRVAQAVLPWGADVNAKNLVLNAPLLLRLMEMRSQSDPSDRYLEGFALDMAGIVQAYSYVDEDESKYFQLVPVGDEDLDFRNSGEDGKELGDMKISEERLSGAYQNVLKRLAQLQSARDIGKGAEKSKRWGGGLELESFMMDLLDDDWTKGMLLEEVVDIDVGYDAPPPSFTASMELRKLRRSRIEAAKCRIDAIRKAPVAIADAADDNTRNVNDSESVLRKEDVCAPQKLVRTRQGRRRKDGGDCIIHKDHPAERSDCGKKRGRKRDSCDGVDWEDCVIELLLLHGANEAEIEQGQYRRLLELHVFSAPSGGR